MDRERRRLEREMTKDRRAYEKRLRPELTPGDVLPWAGAFIALLLSASIVAEKMYENSGDHVRGNLIGSSSDTSSK